MNNRYLVSRSRFITAAPEAVFEVLATPALHSVIDGSDTVKGAQPRGPERLALGARFGMEMKVGVDYKILNTVCEFEEGRRIAWRHFYGHVWRYLFEPVDGGTRVTEQWDARPARNKIFLRLSGFPGRNRKGIVATLQRLEDLASAQ